MATFFSILFIVFFIWLLYEAWRSPVYRENEDGTFRQVTPTKKLSDLFKRKK
jgi:hypothetical protein